MLGDNGTGKHVFKKKFAEFFPSGIIHVGGREFRVTFEPNHRSHCDIVVYCYASNNLHSLQNIPTKWIKKHQKYARRSTESTVILCFLHATYDAVLNEGRSFAIQNYLHHHVFPISNEARAEQKRVYEAIFTFASLSMVEPMLVS
uniref:Uncharacterized protein n=1 Tax=Ciona savignyi TaxID=51511 RepID=H2YEB8_CIOSA